MESHLILKISSPILVQFWEKMEAKNTVKTVVEQHIVTFWAPGAGIKSPGVNPQTALHLFNVGVSSTLTYGCASIYINKSQLVNLTYKTVSWFEMLNTYYSSHESLRN